MTVRDDDRDTALLALLDDLGVGHGILRLLPDERELLPYLLKDVPGDVGVRLRAHWYQRLFGALGADCVIGPGVTLVHPERMFLGAGVCLTGNLHLEALGGDGRITLSDGVYLGWGSYVNTWLPGGYVQVGSRTWIGAGAQIWGHVGVEIGAHCLIAPGLFIVPYQHEFGDTGRPIGEQDGIAGRVVVEDDVYAGMSVRLLANTVIGHGTVIGAGAVVTRPLPAEVVAAGVPARILRKRGPGERA